MRTTLRESRKKRQIDVNEDKRSFESRYGFGASLSTLALDELLQIEVIGGNSQRSVVGNMRSSRIARMSRVSGMTCSLMPVHLAACFPSWLMMAGLDPLVAACNCSRAMISRARERYAAAPRDLTLNRIAGFP